jgi:hypothetical protein
LALSQYKKAGCHRLNVPRYRVAVSARGYGIAYVTAWLLFSAAYTLFGAGDFQSSTVAREPDTLKHRVELLDRVEARLNKETWDKAIKDWGDRPPDPVTQYLRSPEHTFT